MSAEPGKVDVQRIRGERVFVLRFLQRRDPDWMGVPFFAEFDPKPTWLDPLRPAFGEARFFFEERMACPGRANRRAGHGRVGSAF